MSYIAEIFVLDGELTPRLKEIPAWLEDHQFEPVLFHYVQRENGMMIQAEFMAKDEAIAFAQQFGGRISGGYGGS